MRKNHLVLGAGVMMALAVGAYSLGRGAGGQRTPIRVGVLHSLTGTMAISEKAVADATLFAIEQLNARGGVLGRPVEAVVADGQSDSGTFAREAERLITEKHVQVIFGCWTSASRKTVKAVLERHKHLLFYPVQYEGLEQSPYVVYTGAAPNQQIIPAVKWAFDNLGRRFYLAASDYVFPWAANAIIKDQVRALRGEIVGEWYLLLGSRDVAGMVAEIVKTHPDVIINTINGDSNVVFFRELRRAGITADRIPTMSFSIAEGELGGIDTPSVVGDYAAWNYFQSIPSAENRAFVDAFKARYGAERVLDDPMEAAYFGVSLWAAAVEAAGSAGVGAVRETIGGQALTAPEGIVYVDPETQHTWRPVRIGRIRADGQFDILWSSEHAVQPAPFPVSRTRTEWEEFLSGLFTRWNGHWANVGA